MILGGEREGAGGGGGFTAVCSLVISITLGIYPFNLPRRYSSREKNRERMMNMGFVFVYFRSHVGEFLLLGVLLAELYVPQSSKTHAKCLGIHCASTTLVMMYVD